MNTTEKKKTILSFVNNLKQSIGINRTLSEMGVKTSDIPSLANKAVKDICIYTNPRKATKRDIEVIYEEAL
jgi:alcohol dehydrogenase class IV